MELLSVTDGKPVVAFEPSELIFLNNAVNETLEAIDDREFQTRTGSTRLQAKAILAQIDRILKVFSPK